MKKQKFQRRNKLPDPRLQLRMTGAFVATTAIALLLQFLLFARNLTDVANALPQDGAVLVEASGSLLLRTLLVSFAVVLPVTLAVGVLVTFRVAGPLYRFRAFMRDVIAGGHPEECRIRKGDELHDICELLNEVTQPLRVQSEALEPETRAETGAAA